MKWDSLPAIRWDAGHYWDRPVPPFSDKEINMQLFKVVFDFINLGFPKFGDKARFIVTCLTTEPMLTLVPNPFPPGIPTRPAMLTALSDYETAADAAKDSKAAKKDRDKKRDILTGMLKDFAPHLETTAKAAGDITILSKSGYNLRRPTVQSLTNGTPPQPVITLKRGKVSGSVIARAKPLLPHVTTYEGQYAVGESSAEANFKPGTISVTGSRITYTGLEVAKLHQIRVRGIGTTGPGDWSSPASIIVT